MGEVGRDFIVVWVAGYEIMRGQSGSYNCRRRRTGRGDEGCWRLWFVSNSQLMSE
ncbi:hypothetical protein Hanom_Chr15g01347651 [Helianthus anomalus]